jgi:O-antigen biosynthesis protein
LRRDLTVVTVNYNSKDYLEQCLHAIHRETRLESLQIVVVDNASEDQDFSSLQARFPDVDFVCNSVNYGFSTACNQGIRKHPAACYLLVNPDCQIRDDAIGKTFNFLRQRQDAGIAGCRVVHPDGSLQLACRRSIPRPSTAFYRFLGLSRLFPRSRRFARYNLTYLDEREISEVEAVSGSFLMVRDEVIRDIGLLDQDFFLYGEDLDFCLRAGERGWKVLYYPDAEVVHFKRRSSRKNSHISNYHYYYAMELFYRKHFRGRSGPLQNAAVFAGVQALWLANRVRRLFIDKHGAGSQY